MEITTLVTWNGLTYFLYYGVNIGFDILRFKRKNSETSTIYTYQEIINEKPVKLEATVIKASSNASSLPTDKQTKTFESPVQITGPIEDQGIPFDEFMKNSKHYSSNIQF